MIISTNIARRTTIVVPDATTVLEGQVFSNTGSYYSSLNALGTEPYGAGVAMVDVPAKAVYTPGSASLPRNSPRATPFATEGLVAIRVADAAAFAALTVNGRFGILNGNAVAVGTGGTLAAVFGNAYNIMTVKTKARGPGGEFFITVEIQ
jgi:hypothetical protein